MILLEILISLLIKLAGWVAEVEGHDCLVCPYHGLIWAYAPHGEGVLQGVPA